MKKSIVLIITLLCAGQLYGATTPHAACENKWPGDTCSWAPKGDPIMPFTGTCQPEGSGLTCKK